jgi:hypothetical protein
VPALHLRLLHLQRLTNPHLVVSLSFASAYARSEIKERTRHLKRLSFVVHSGRLDQYARFLPLMVEKVVDSLKITNAMSLHTQVRAALRSCQRCFSRTLTLFWYSGLQSAAHPAGARLFGAPRVHLACGPHGAHSRLPG